MTVDATTARTHDPMCMGCGPANPNNLGVTVRFEGDRVRGEVLLDERHSGAPGFAHGGAIAAVMDDLLGQVLIPLDRPGVTATMTVDFRGPALLGRTLVLEGWCEKIDGRKLHMRGEMPMATPSSRRPGRSSSTSTYPTGKRPDGRCRPTGRGGAGSWPRGMSPRRVNQPAPADRDVPRSPGEAYSSRRLISSHCGDRRPGGSAAARSRRGASRRGGRRPRGPAERPRPRHAAALLVGPSVPGRSVGMLHPVVRDLERHPLDGGIHRRLLRHRPGPQHAVDLEAQVEVRRARVLVPADDEEPGVHPADRELLMALDLDRLRVDPSTSAAGGPSAGRRPTARPRRVASAWTSTVTPSCPLRTQPCTPRSRARATVLSRKKTPCTLPVTVARIATSSDTQEPPDDDAPFSPGRGGPGRRHRSSSTPRTERRLRPRRCARPPPPDGPAR